MMDRRLVLSIIFIALGIAVFIIGTKSIRGYYKTKSSDWVKKEALIAKIQDKDVESTGFSIRAKGVKRVRTVLLSYAVNGREYLLPYDNFVSGMRVGKEVTIAYNPASPDQFAYKPKLGEYIGYIVLALGLIVLGGYIVVLVRRDYEVE